MNSANNEHDHETNKKTNKTKRTLTHTIVLCDGFCVVDFYLPSVKELIVMCLVEQLTSYTN